MKPAAHLTCVGASCDEIRQTLRDYHSAGVRHVVALRGDPPTGFDAPHEAVPDGYKSTAELVADATEMGFEVSVGTYPETRSAESDLAARHRDPEAEGERGRDAGHHPVLLRQFCLFPLSRRRRGSGARRSDRARNLSGAELQADRQFRPGEPGRASRAGWPTGSLASRTIRRRGASLRRRSAPSRSSTSSTTGSRNCISTP